MSLNGLNQEYRFKSLNGMTNINFDGIEVNNITINQTARYEYHTPGVVVLNYSILGTTNNLNVNYVAIQGLGANQVVTTNASKVFKLKRIYSNLQILNTKTVSGCYLLAGCPHDWKCGNEFVTP